MSEHADIWPIRSLDEATSNRVRSKIEDAMEQAWLEGVRGHPRPSQSKSLGHIKTELLNIIHAAAKREANVRAEGSESREQKLREALEAVLYETEVELYMRDGAIIDAARALLRDEQEEEKP